MQQHPRTELAPPLLTIEPRKGWIGIDWRELFNARELLYFLVLRDIMVRYKQTALGVAWAALQPLFTMLIFTLIFGHFAKLPSDGQPCAVRVRRLVAVDLLF
jgi:lipopolysaccharide transport system permease protein